MPSPVVKYEKDGLTFPTALEHVINGMKIARYEWGGDPDEYVTRHKEWLCIHHAGEPKDQFHALLVSDGDLLADDWYVI